MSHSYNAHYVHVVFSTKERRAALTPEVRVELFALLMSIARRLGTDPVRVGGWVDHVHLLIRFNATSQVASLVRDLKANSSRWVHEHWPAKKDFAWQEGYAAFSVSPGTVESVKRYIETQEEHHRRISFREEYLEFLRSAGIEYDERFVLG
ncbi:MAG: IS200/IS605 family transposase [Thermoanaerobaculia bacterium]|jgi:REP element-mobilizing transposase RayT